MQLIFLDDYPSQQFTFPIGDVNYDVTFMYNQMAQRWSISIWSEAADCPLIGGRFIESGRDLAEGLFSDDLLIALDRPGVNASGLDWYQRLTRSLSDGLPATLLVVGSKDELADLIKPEPAIAC